MLNLELIKMRLDMLKESGVGPYRSHPGYNQVCAHITAQIIADDISDLIKEVERLRKMVKP